MNLGLFGIDRHAKEAVREETINVAELRDRQADSERVKRSEWLIVVGVCTYPVCVPIANAVDFGGYVRVTVRIMTRAKE